MKSLARLTLAAVILLTLVGSSNSQTKGTGSIQSSSTSSRTPRLRKSPADQPQSSKDQAEAMAASSAPAQLAESLVPSDYVIVQYWYTDRHQFFIQGTYANTAIRFKIGQDNTAYSDRGVLEFSYDNVNFAPELIMTVVTDANGNGASNFYYVAGVDPGQSEKRICSTNLAFQECLDPELYTVVANDDPDRRVENPDKAPTATDSNFVASTGPGLDTQYSYFWGGPLVINIPVNRVVSEDVNADGTLTNPEALVRNGVVPEFVKLRLSAFDVDYDGDSPPFNPERDRVLFNGVDIGPDNSKAYLTGKDMEWSVNELSVPVRLVRFGQTTMFGQPQPGLNRIEIRIDEDNMDNVAGRGQARWSTSIDWAALSFDAMYPVIMVHGNSSCGNFFAGDYNAPCTGERTPEDRWFIRPFKEQGIPFDYSINMQVASVDKHADELAILIPGIASKFGVKHVHIIAHSKGGLDVRKYLTLIEPGTLGVLSLTTISTPHLGSVGADYQMDAAEGIRANRRRGLTRGVWETIRSSDSRVRTALAIAVGTTDGTPSLRVDAARKFNEENIPFLPRAFTVDGETTKMHYFAFSADANYDRSNEDNINKPYIEFIGYQNPWRPTISADEADGLPWIKLPVIGTEFPAGKGLIYQQIYNLLGTVKSTRLMPRTGGPMPIRWGIVEESGQLESQYFLTNDFAVTEVSATLGPVTVEGSQFKDPYNLFTKIQWAKLNHASISIPETAVRIIAFIREANPAH